MPSSIPLVDAPFQNPPASPLEEVEVTDPTHPLFGQRFPLACGRQQPGYADAVLVVYRQTALLRIPRAATNLGGDPLPTLRTKLTPQAVGELVGCFQEVRACPTPSAGSDNRATQP
jgi:hypothetical protein